MTSVPTTLWRQILFSVGGGGGGGGSWKSQDAVTEVLVPSPKTATGTKQSVDDLPGGSFPNVRRGGFLLTPVISHSRNVGKGPFVDKYPKGSNTSFK